jgi:hypothetical protein
VCLYVLSVILSLLGKNLVTVCPQQQRIVWGMFYAVHDVSKESRQFFPELLVVLELSSSFTAYIVHIVTYLNDYRWIVG